MEKLEHLKIPFEEIKSATNDFAVENFLGKGGFGPVYKGELFHSERHRNVAVKRLDSKCGQGRREFLTEIAMLSSYKHKNLASLVCFCDEGVEKILVYELETRGSLDKYLSCVDLMWLQRLKICLGVGQGLNYLHSGVGADHRVIHRDVKSSNVLLDENWEAKLSDFGLSKIGASNQQFTFLVSNACGTMGYVDPEYVKTGILTKESDVYSFGVLLFEVLCGRSACMSIYEDERRFLARLAQLRYEEDRLIEIISPNLREEMNMDSWKIFSRIAYQCLEENRSKRPTTGLIVAELQKALEHQLAMDMVPNAQLAQHFDTKEGSSLPRRKRKKDEADGLTVRVPAPMRAPEDGYRLRKYGQKEIIGSRFPRVKPRSEQGNPAMVRAPCVDENGRRKGAWSEEEDEKLRAYIKRYRVWNWRAVPKSAGLSRCGKSCRLRWLNYLQPNVKRGNFTMEEENLIIKYQQDMGNRWSAIAAKLPGRRDIEIKNHWHSHLKKHSTRQDQGLSHDVEVEEE